MNEFTRTELLLGTQTMEKLKSASVAVFGVGGVGSYVAEALARSGIGSLSLFDNDTVSITNLNRQLVALHSTLGLLKVDVMAARAKDINPQIDVQIYPVFYTEENADTFDLSHYSYIVDAIDTVSSKLELAKRAYHAGIPIISSMGAGNKLDPTRFEIADIFETSVCPLAKVMRRELKKRGIPSLKTVYSKEEPRTPAPSKQTRDEAPTKRQIPGSVSFVPSVAGLILAGAVIADLQQMD